MCRQTHRAYRASSGADQGSSVGSTSLTQQNYTEQKGFYCYHLMYHLQFTADDIFKFCLFKKNTEYHLNQALN